MPIKIGEDTGVLLKGKIVSKDKEWSLMTVDCGNIALHIGDNGQPIGSPASLRILAREVVFAKEQPSGLSVQNAFEGVVEEISVQKDSSGALIRANCSGQIIVGKLTRKALSELDIKEGSQIWLLVKSVALAFLFSLPEDLHFVRSRSAIIETKRNSDIGGTAAGNEINLRILSCIRQVRRFFVFWSCLRLQE